MQFLRTEGAGRVIVVEPRERRRGLALQLGADLAVAPADEALTGVRDPTGGLDAGLVFDCVGNRVAFTAATELCRPGTTIIGGRRVRVLQRLAADLAEQGIDRRHLARPPRPRFRHHGRPPRLWSAAHRAAARTRHRARRPPRRLGRPGRRT
ncbi:hypothetical protein SipoB123_32720 [Streptomyces ipomoeae]|nr:hypothetical protein SipoB123_32720 [Streptomyces ipomoeae]